MARSVSLLLVLANLLFFVWASGYLGGQDEGREPERLKAQVHPDRLKVAVREDKEQATVPAPAVEPQPPVLPAVEFKPAQESPPSPVVCRRIGPLPKAEADKLAASLAKGGGKVDKSSAADDGNTYWVFVPAAEATPRDKKSAELKQAGVTDFFFASEGPNKGAISLGVYHREEAARDLLQRLHAKGIAAAKVETRPRKADRLLVDVRAPADVIAKLLADQRAPIVDCPKE